MPAETESLLEFPCVFPVKVFGEDTPEFLNFVFDTVKGHVPDLQESDISRNASRNGRYVALTVSFTATSREQLDNIYRQLSAHPLVLMAL